VLKSIQAARPDGYRLFDITGNLAASKTQSGPGRSPVRSAPLSSAAQTTGITRAGPQAAGLPALA
jgi:hypothetical protein